MFKLYRLGVWFYAAMVFVVQAFSAKAKDRVQGASQVFDKLSATPQGQSCYWMHCASVGEFEQGRPLWDKLQKAFPQDRFVLSFFSPSGYNAFKDKKQVGEVVYLPWDLGNNCDKFIEILSPQMAIFVKYEWWIGYFRSLSKLNVPTIVISVAFRPDQIFFKNRLLSPLFRETLKELEHLFVQNKESSHLLDSIDIKNYTVAGDTRLDRTLNNRTQELDHPYLNNWASLSEVVLVAGSTWPQDEILIAQNIANKPELNIIIAPHEVHEKNISACKARFLSALKGDTTKVKTLTEFSKIPLVKNVYKARVIIIDSIGLLSRLYRLGNMAYIGGGFGAGIHNTLEAVVYEIPIAFGPKHQKFIEAKMLVEQKIASSIRSAQELEDFINTFSTSENGLIIRDRVINYIEQNQGATQRIWDKLIESKLV